MFLLFIPLCFYYLLFVTASVSLTVFLLLHILLCYYLFFLFFPLFIWKLFYISSIPLVVTASFPVLISKTIFICCYIKARHQIKLFISYKINSFIKTQATPFCQCSLLTCGMKTFALLSFLPKVPIPNTLLLQYFPPLDFAEIIFYFLLAIFIFF